MKKIALILALGMGLSLLAGCSGSSTGTTTAAETTTAADTTEAVTEEESAEEVITGGWEIQDATPLEMDDAATEAFEKAAEGLVGATLEPIAVIATQIVAGTNYCFLVKSTPVVPDAVSHYAFAYVYADLEGNAEITGTKDIEIDVDAASTEVESTEGLAGGWTIAEFDGTGVDDADVIESALEEFVGSDIVPIARIATQVVAGENYCFVVAQTPVSPDAQTNIELAYVYKDLSGKCEFIGFTVLDYMPEE